MDLKPPNLTKTKTDNTPDANNDNLTQHTHGHSLGNSPPLSSVVHQADEGAEASGSGLERRSLDPLNHNNEEAHATGSPVTLSENQSPTIEMTQQSEGQELRSTPHSDSIIATLEPYSQSRRNRRRGRRIMNLEFNQMPFQETPYKKFFTVKLNEEGDLRQVDIIQANRDLERMIGGRPNKISELNNGTLLIEVSNQQQSERMSQINQLSSLGVTAEPHRTLNTCKGTIYFQNHQNYSEQTLLEELSRFKVIEMKPMRNTRRPNTVHILTFDLLEVPEYVHIGWRRLRVREFIPRPCRCYKCQKWGHGSNRCRSDCPICMRCAGPYHGRECNNTVKCPNCSQNHQASSTQCYYFKLEQETLKIQYKERLNYFDSKRKASRNLNESYAAVTQRSPEMPSRTEAPVRVTERTQTDRIAHSSSQLASTNPAETNQTTEEPRSSISRNSFDLLGDMIVNSEEMPSIADEPITEQKRKRSPSSPEKSGNNPKKPMKMQTKTGSSTQSEKRSLSTNRKLNQSYAAVTQRSLELSDSKSQSGPSTSNNINVLIKDRSRSQDSRILPRSRSQSPFIRPSQNKSAKTADFDPSRPPPTPYDLLPTFLPPPPPPPQEKRDNSDPRQSRKK